MLRALSVVALLLPCLYVTNAAVAHEPIVIKPEASASLPEPPVFPSSFEATYTFSIPYVYTVQTRGLSFPVHMWYDGKSQRLRMDVFDGLDSTITEKDVTYLVYPRIDKVVCDTIRSDVGPTLQGMLLGSAPLPDLSDWHYGGSTNIGNEEVNIWQMFTKKWGKTSTYTFYTTPQGRPVRLYMMGVNILSYSHFDEYLVDFSTFKPGPIPDDVFTVPSMCKDDKQPSSSDTGYSDLKPVSVKGATAGVLASVAAMPWAHLPGRTDLSSSSDLQQSLQQQVKRLAARAANQQFVGAWNAQNSNQLGYKLAVNRFVDWLPEEYSSLMTAKRSTARSEQIKSQSLAVFEAPPGLTKKHLPKHVDWRGTGADATVKDQATCGSCWAFSAVGAMQGAWYLATGQVLSLSEQQLVDCSWDYGNNGCQGGEMEPAIQYIADHGGAAAEEDYQYRGQNMFCGSNATRKDFAPVARFKGFAHVKKRDELSLMYALWKHGPVAISLDASQPSFKFYSEGVYKEKKCLTKKGQLDHAVLVVGYGTDKLSGEDYWLIKNSWSKYWGEDGYIRMLRTPGDGNDCGITSDPVMAVVHPDYVTQQQPQLQIPAAA